MSNIIQLELEIQRYLDDLKATNKVTDNTLGAYRRDLNAFVSYLKENNINSMVTLTNEDIKKYIKSIKDAKLSNATTARKISVIKGILKYFISTGELKEDVLNDIEAPKVEHKVQEVISDEIISKLIDNISLKSEKDYRDKAMIGLMAWTGMRVSELIEIDVADYSISEKVLYLNENTSISLDSSIADSLEQYLNIREQKESNYMFPNTFGEKMTRQGFWKILKTRAEKAGLEAEQINPNSLRQSLITKLFKDGLSVQEVQTLLRYKGKERLDSIYIKLKQSGIIE